jgi:hypothetical protein
MKKCKRNPGPIGNKKFSSRAWAFYCFVTLRSRSSRNRWVTLKASYAVVFGEGHFVISEMPRDALCTEWAREVGCLVCCYLEQASTVKLMHAVKLVATRDNEGYFG